MSDKIIHIDMDAFFASVEQRDNPSLRGRPVVVGGAPDRRGVIAAASYEARKYGLHSAMSSARALHLCPETVFVRPRFDVYRAESQRIQAVFRRYTALVEPLSLDEAYLDVSSCSIHSGSATLIAKAIKQAVREETGLTASAGVSYNKFLAKQASDLDKPDGLYLIRPEQGAAFVAALAVGKFHGVGRATEARMHTLGIYTGADLARLGVDELTAAFGKRGRFYHDIARGIDERAVQPSRERKSIGSETTFVEDLHDPAAMLAALHPLVGKVLAHLYRCDLGAETITLKVKYHDFRQVTRSHTVARRELTIDMVIALLKQLLDRTEAATKPVRLLGITASSLYPLTVQQLGLGW